MKSLGASHLRVQGDLECLRGDVVKAVQSASACEMPGAGDRMPGGTLSLKDMRQEVYIPGITRHAFHHRAEFGKLGDQVGCRGGVGASPRQRHDPGDSLLGQPVCHLASDRAGSADDQGRARKVPEPPPVLASAAFDPAGH